MRLLSLSGLVVSRFRPVFLSLIALGFAALSACDKVALLAPTGSTLTLSINTTTVPINGTAIVTASVIESAGTPVHDGTIVTFTSSFGTIQPAESATSGGTAVATFRGTSSGTAKISAFSGAAKAEITDVKVGSAAAGSVSLRVEPSTVPQNGGTVTAIALVQDTGGNVLPGAPVVFTTDQGSLGSSSVLSDANGFAQTTLTTNRVTKVTASVADKRSEVTVNVVTAPTVTITSATANPTVGSPVSFLVTPSSAATANPIQSVVVDFGDGQTQQLGSITGPVGLTHAYSTHGGYTVTATATDINGQRGVSSLAVVVAPVALPTVSLSAAPNPILVTGNGFTTFTVTATAGSSPIRSVVVRLANGTTIYTGTGGGSFTYQFGTFPGGATYTVTASVTDALGNVGTTSIVVVLNGS
jgi:hypothetical protein